MITPKQMAEAYGRNVQIIKLQTAGLSQAQTLIQLPFRANCLNWIVGHIVTNRNAVMKLLSAEPALDTAQAARYTRESEPITAADADVLPIADLVAALEQSQTRLAELLDTITPEELSRPVAFFGGRSLPISEWLMFFYFHDSYHTGQTEILRQATGVDDKII